MSMSRHLGLLLILLITLAGSCKSVQVEEYDCGCCLQCKYKALFDDALECGCCEADAVATPDSGPEDAFPVDGDGGPVGPVPWVGKACVEHTECTPGMCFTPKFLKDSFGLDVPALEIPNGMCSFPMCNTEDPESDQCGPQGTCFNTKPFSGTDLGICLLECTGMSDCRWEDGYQCFRVAKEDEKGACIPDSLQVIIECDDGHCEGQPEELGACDELADCPWKQDYTCYWPDLAAEEGICIGDSEAVAIECDDGHCPIPNVADE